MSELVDLIQRLVAINSINPDLVPGSAGEMEIARFVAGWLENAGLQVTLEEITPGRANVIAVARGRGGGQALMLNAHTDTVGVTGMENPFEARLDGNRLYGRGAYDMKASLAAIMVAGARAAQKSLAGNVIITAVCDEEYASIGTKQVADNWTADAAIITEATALDVCIAHKGFIWLEITTTGRAAHGSRPDRGVDAIVKMGKVLTALERHGFSLLNSPSHPLLNSGSIHASLISGGQELSSYPERCVLQVERRTVPGESVETVTEEMEMLLNEIRERDPDFRAGCRVTLSRDAFEVSPDEPIVKTVRAHAKDVRGSDPALIGVPFWMDSALLSAAHIPTVIFGPDGEGAHAVDEWVDIDSVVKCLEVYDAVIADFCAESLPEQPASSESPARPASSESSE